MNKTFCLERIIALIFFRFFLSILFVYKNKIKKNSRNKDFEILIMYINKYLWKSKKLL